MRDRTRAPTPRARAVRRDGTSALLHTRRGCLDRRTLCCTLVCAMGKVNQNGAQQGKGEKEVGHWQYSLTHNCATHLRQLEKDRANCRHCSCLSVFTSTRLLLLQLCTTFRSPPDPVRLIDPFNHQIWLGSVLPRPGRPLYTLRLHCQETAELTRGARIAPAYPPSAHALNP